MFFESGVLFAYFCSYIMLEPSVIFLSIYVYSVFPCDHTEAWYITLVCRQLKFSGHSEFFQQLYVGFIGYLCCTGYFLFQHFPSVAVTKFYCILLNILCSLLVLGSVDEFDEYYTYIRFYLFYEFNHVKIFLLYFFLRCEGFAKKKKAIFQWRFIIAFSFVNIFFI